MTTLYVDNIAPNLQSKISAPNLTLPTGSVIQVVQGQSSGQFVTSSLDTYQDIGLEVTITPSSSSSKILVHYYSGFVGQNTAHLNTRMLRNGSTVHTLGLYFSGAHWQGAVPSAMILDSPSSTSALTYKIQGFQDSGSSNYANWHYNGNASHIIAMEIAG